MANFLAIEEDGSHEWAKLTASQVLEIRQLNKLHGLGCRRLSRRFGISASTIKDILNGKNWSYLKETV